MYYYIPFKLIKYDENPSSVYGIFIKDSNGYYRSIVYPNEILFDFLDADVKIVKRNMTHFDRTYRHIKMIEEDLNYKYIKHNTRDDAIIAMTSYPKRISVAYRHIILLNKSCPSFRVVLTLSKDEFPNGEDDLPNGEDDLPNGMGEVCDILWITGKYKSQKKWIFAMEKFPDKYIITADDDMVYSNDYATELLNFLYTHPEEDVCSYSIEPRCVDVYVGGAATAFSPKSYKYFLMYKDTILQAPGEDAFPRFMKKLNICYLNLRDFRNYAEFGACDNTTLNGVHKTILDSLLSKSEFLKLPRISYEIERKPCIFPTENNMNIFIYWEGKEYTLIKMFRKLMFKYLKNVYFITDENIYEYIEADALPDVFWMLSPAHRADWVRVYMVEKYGGVWIDSDTLILPSVQQFLANNPCFFITESNIHIWCGLFASKAHSSLMKRWKTLMDYILNHKRGHKIRWNDIGNDILTKLYAEERHLYNDFSVFDGRKSFYPINWDEQYRFLEKVDNIDKWCDLPFIVTTNSLYKELENKSEEEILKSDTLIGKLLNYSYNH